MSIKRLVLNMPVAVTACAVLSPMAAGQATFQGLGDLPGGTFQSIARGVSGDGSVIVGRGQSASGPEAFRWTSSSGMQGLGDLPGGFTESVAYAISGDGSAVIGYSGGNSGLEAFRWTSSGGMQGIGDLPGGFFDSRGYGVSGDGSSIVGVSSVSSGNEAFRWTSAGGMQGLGDLPGGTFGSAANGANGDGSIVVGHSTSASGTEAFRWTSASGMQALGDLPGGSFQSIANAVSGDGSTIVGRGWSASGIEAFRWTSGSGMQGLGDLLGGAFESVANGVSADGSTIVGYGHYTGTGKEAFIWSAADGMQRLKDVLQNHGLNLTGWTLREAHAISGDGLTIAGWGISPGGAVNEQVAWVAGLPGSPHVPTWNVNSSGDWHNHSNWLFIPANSVDAKVRFAGAITSNRTVFTDTPVTVGTIQFDNLNSYLLAGQGVLTLQVSSGSALVDVLQGSHKINLPLIVASDTTLNVSGGATLYISDPLTVNAGKSVTQTGGGSVIYQATVNVQSGGSIAFGNSSRLHALALDGSAVATIAAGGNAALMLENLSLAATAKLDVADNDLLIDYTGDSPYAQIRGYVLTGISGNSGIKIQQSPANDRVLALMDTADLSTPPATWLGVAVDATTVIGKYTYFGDGNLDGKITGEDYGPIDANLGHSTIKWIEGDYNLDGVISGEDYGYVDGNLGKGTDNPLAYAALKAEMVALHTEMFGEPYLAVLRAVEAGEMTVPEPAGVLGLALSTGLLRRRRR